MNRFAQLRTLLVAVAAAALLVSPLAQAGPAGPDVPGAIAVESGHKVFLVGHAVGVQIYSCNTTSTGSFICNNPQLCLGQTRETLVWRQSSDNGASFSAASIIAPVTNNQGTYINNYGSAIFHEGSPYVLWNAHNAAYTAYTNQLRVGSGTP